MLNVEPPNKAPNIVNNGNSRDVICSAVKFFGMGRKEKSLIQALNKNNTVKEV